MQKDNPCGPTNKESRTKELRTPVPKSNVGTKVSKGGHVAGFARPRSGSPRRRGSPGLYGARAPPPAELKHLLRGIEPQLLDFS